MRLSNVVRLVPPRLPPPTKERVRCRALLLSTAVLLVACGCETRVDTLGTVENDATSSKPQFDEPATCGSCHPTHYAEWQGSIMHYAAMSPVFNAFELTIRKITDGLVAPNGAAPNLCVGCHSPTGVFENELPDYIDAERALPVRNYLTRVSREGISCDFCHSVTGPDLSKSLLGDGIANTSLLFGPSETKFGPLVNPVSSGYHASASTDLIKKADFCGACHDVRLPIPDVVTGEPFQRLENLFTEWQTGPYNSTDNPYGRVVRCQDCHMSLYPLAEPGMFPSTPLAVGANMPIRPHAIHAFTAVSIPFLDDPQFPQVDTDEKDQWGFPRGQAQRRRQMLRAACTLTLDGTPTDLTRDAAVIPIRTVVTNVGAGHRVPSGFSQERQVWIELTVRDDVGLIYESGYLRDKAHAETGELEPDGLLHDEDLDDRHFTVNLETLDSRYEPGPDHDQRPAKNLGIKNFQNAFVRIGADGSRELVINPLLASTVDNSRSLPILEPVEVRYDIPVPDRGIVGDIHVSARLRYRAFPPEFLRVLAIREPQIVSEEMVDRNLIVDMAEAQTTITVR
ncbi:MAG: multiheme c-type cytochrome [Phycisphaerae bacterium]